MAGVLLAGGSRSFRVRGRSLERLEPLRAKTSAIATRRLFPMRILKKPLCKAPAPSDDNRGALTPNDRQKRSMRGMFTPAQNVSADDASFDGRSRQKLTHTNEAREYQHVPMRPNNMPTEAKEFSCHTPRTEDARPSRTRDEGGRPSVGSSAGVPP
jgi:hypothetical protein